MFNFARILINQNNQDDLGDVLQFGIIKSVDLEAYKAICEIGDIETPPLEWLAPTGAIKIFCPPTVGEQVLIASPDGDINGGVILGAVFSTRNPPPTSDRLLFIQHGSSQLIIADDKITINSEFIVNGKTTFNGDNSITGKSTVTDDVIAGGISLKNHQHLGVKAGSDKSGAPT